LSLVPGGWRDGGARPAPGKILICSITSVEFHKLFFLVSAALCICLVQLLEGCTGRPVDIIQGERRSDIQYLGFGKGTPVEGRYGPLGSSIRDWNCTVSTASTDQVSELVGIGLPGSVQN
jgi:hypothetical protein